MPTLHRLEDSKNRSRAGILVTWDDGTAKQASFTVTYGMDAQGTGKRIAAQVLQALMDGGRVDLANSTNWVSMVAGCAKHVVDAMLRLPVEGSVIQ